MSKRYSPASQDVTHKIAELREEHYSNEAFELVTVGALFVFNEAGEPVLTHRGYPAAALARIVSSRDRAVGMTDAQIVVDRVVWQGLTTKQQIALLDHELHHLEVVLDKDGSVRFDAQDRPKLKIRKHDWEFGWFDEIANRHGADSIERLNARRLVEATGQLYFDFGPQRAAA